MSSVAEAGVGTAYEFKVATYLWGLLAAQEEFPVGGGQITLVGCQRSHKETGFDDFEVHTRQEVGAAQRWFLQAKRTVRVQASNLVFAEVIRRVHEDSQKPTYQGALFVLVVERMSDSHVDAFTVITNLARASITANDFRQKLVFENKDARSAYDAVLKIVTAEGEATNEDQVYATLSALHLWHLQVEDWNSLAWTVWRSLLTACVPLQSRGEVEQLRKAFFEAVPKESRYRREFDFRSLRQSFPGFDRPVQADPSATPLALDTLERYRQQIRVWSEERHKAAYETLVTVSNFVSEASSRISTHGLVGQTAHELATITAEACALEGKILVALGFEQQYGNWLTRASGLASVSDPLRETCARVSLEIGDIHSFQEFFAKIEDPEARALLSAWRYAHEGDWSTALKHAQTIQGSRRSIALAACRQFLTELALRASDANEAFNLSLDAMRHCEAAVELSEDWVLLKLMAAESAFLVVSPHISKSYEGAQQVLPSEIAVLLDKSFEVFQEVVSSPGLYGAHERTLAGLCVIDVLTATGRRPYLLPAFFSIDQGYLLQMDPARQCRMAEVCISCGKDDLARQLLENLSQASYSDIVRQAAAIRLEYLRTINEAKAAVVDTETKYDKHGLGLAMLEDVWGHFLSDMEVNTSEVDLDSMHAYDTAWMPAVRFSNAVVYGDEAEAIRNFDELTLRFPEAVITYAVLTIGLKEYFDIVYAQEEVDDEEDDFRRIGERQFLAPRAERIRFWALKILRYVSDSIGITGALDAWISIAAKTLDQAELQAAADVCRSKSYNHGAWTAAFLTEVVRQRPERAVSLYMEAMTEGWQPILTLRHAYDRERERLCLWETLAAEVESWLQFQDRPPTSLEPGIRALLQLERNHEAFQLALANLEDFPDSADAHQTVVRTARASGREDWIKHLLEFAQRFPDDVRAAKTLDVEDAIELIIKPHPKTSLWDLYYEGKIPLLSINDWLTQSFEQCLAGWGFVLWSAPLEAQVLLEPERGVLLDATAVLSADHLGLWELLEQSTLNLFLHPSVLHYFRAESESLTLEARSAPVDAARRVQAFIGRLETEEQLGTTDEEEAQRIGGVACNLSPQVDGGLVSLVKGSSRVGRADQRLLLRRLEAGFGISSREVPSQFADRVVLGARDVHVICEQNVMPWVEACFERVSVSKQGLYWLRRFLAEAHLIGRAQERSTHALRSIKELLGSGRLSLSESSEEPFVTTLRYIEEIGLTARRQGLSVWADDAVTRCVVKQGTPAVETLSTWDMLRELVRSAEHSCKELDSIAREAVQSGYFPVPREDALVLIRDSPFQVQKYLARACKQISPGRVEPILSKRTELVVLAFQFSHLVSVSREGWEQASMELRRNLPKDCAQAFWNACFIKLAGGATFCWREVGLLANWAVAAGQYDYSTGMLLGLEMYSPHIYDSSWRQTRTDAAVKFEFRWRFVRSRLRAARNSR